MTLNIPYGLLKLRCTRSWDSSVLCPRSSKEITIRAFCCKCFARYTMWWLRAVLVWAMAVSRGDGFERSPSIDLIEIMGDSHHLPCAKTVRDLSLGEFRYAGSDSTNSSERL